MKLLNIAIVLIVFALACVSVQSTDESDEVKNRRGKKAAPKTEAVLHSVGVPAKAAKESDLNKGTEISERQ